MLPKIEKKQLTTRIYPLNVRMAKQILVNSVTVKFHIIYIYMSYYITFIYFSHKVIPAIFIDIIGLSV